MNNYTFQATIFTKCGFYFRCYHHWYLSKDIRISM